MNIFETLKEQQRQYDLKIKAMRQKEAEEHNEYLRQHGLTEEDYQQQQEEERQQRHQQELDELGITEKQYQRKLKWREYKEKLSLALQVILAVALVATIIIAMFADWGETVFTIIGGVIFGGIFLFIGCAIYYIIVERLIERLKMSKILRIILGVIITILILVILVYILHFFEPGFIDDAHRPDRF